MRHVKQLIYGIFYLACWAALIGGIYAWKKPAPSCFDGRKNQSEIGVDCGGVCARVCIPATIIPLEVTGSVRLIPLESAAGSPRASLLAQIQNRNLDFGASTFNYSFNVYDQGGAVVASFPDQSFIYPGEVKYLSVPNAVLPAAATASYAKLEIQSVSWTPAVKFPKPKLLVQTVNTIVTVDSGTFVTQGVLVNQDNVDFQTISITAVFYGANGAIAGVSGTQLDGVLTGTSRDFNLFHPVIPGLAPEKTQVFVTAFNAR